MEVEYKPIWQFAWHQRYYRWYQLAWNQAGCRIHQFLPNIVHRCNAWVPDISAFSPPKQELQLWTRARGIICFVTCKTPICHGPVWLAPPWCFPAILSVLQNTDKYTVLWSQGQCVRPTSSLFLTPANFTTVEVGGAFAGAVKASCTKPTCRGVSCGSMMRQEYGSVEMLREFWSRLAHCTECVTWSSVPAPV